MRLVVAIASLCMANVAQAQAAMADPAEVAYKELTQQVGQQAFQVYQTKLLQLIESYSYNVDPDGQMIEYVTNNKVCRMGNRPGTVYRLSYLSEVSDSGELKEAVTRIQHDGCNDKNVINEMIVVTGKDPKPVTSFAALTGLRNFSTPDNQLELQYEVTDFNGNTIFRLLEENLPEERRFTFSVKDDVLLNVTYDKVDKILLVRNDPIHVTWKYIGGTLNINYNNGTEDYILSPGRVSPLEVWSGRHQHPESMKEYRNFLVKSVFTAIDYSSTSLLKYFDSLFLPFSSFTNTGSAGDRLKNELRRMVERIQSGDKQTVIAELAKLIEAVEKGQLKDLRP